MRQLGLDELDLLTDSQLERVVARCAQLQREQARQRMLALRRQSASEPPPVQEPPDAVLAISAINTRLLAETAKLQGYEPGFVRRLGVGKVISFAGKQFAAEAAPIIAQIESLYQQRRVLEVLQTTQAVAVAARAHDPNEDTFENFIQLRIKNTFVLLDLRLRPTGAVRRIQRKREQARKLAERMKREAKAARERAREECAAPTSAGSKKRKRQSVRTAVNKPQKAKPATHHQKAAPPSRPRGQTITTPPAPEQPRMGQSRSVRRALGRRDPSYMRSKVYVLALEHGKFYVGRCTNFPLRVRYHIEGRGAGWTKMYRPLASHAFYWGEEAEEKAVTLHYMDVYGVENVRGWALAKAGEYDPDDIEYLLRDCVPPIPIGHLEACDTLKPMVLERSPLWDINRLQASEGVIFEDVQTW